MATVQVGDATLPSPPTAVTNSILSIWGTDTPASGGAWSQPASPDPAKITFALRQKEGTSAAHDVIAKMSSASTTPALVSAYAEALRSLPPQSGERAAELQKALVPALLNLIVTRSPEESPSRDPTSPERVARLNAGALLGELFLLKYLCGDGLQVAQRIVGSADISLESQFAAACNIAEPCSVDGDATSATAFWTMVAHLAGNHEDAAVRATLADRLARYVRYIIAAAYDEESIRSLRGNPGHANGGMSIGSRSNEEKPTGRSDEGDASDSKEGTDVRLIISPKLPSPSSSVKTIPPQSVFKANPLPRAVDSTEAARSNPVDSDSATGSICILSGRVELSSPPVRRTVFISDILDELSPQNLKAVLEEFGTPLKVRIVQGTKSFMGYCEMSTEAAAKKMVAAGKAAANGTFIRFQSVKNAISGSDTTDATVDADGNITTICSFGRSTAPFSQQPRARIGNSRKPNANGSSQNSNVEKLIVGHH